MKFEAILKFSYIKYQVPNIGKTKSCHFSDTSTYDDLYIDENISIKSVTNEKEYRYLGMLFFPTKNDEILERNIKKKNGKYFEVLCMARRKL